MPEAPGTRRQEGAPSQPRQAFSGQEGGAGPGNSHSSAYKSGRDSRAFGRGQSQAPGAPARGAMSQQRGQWENLPEYVSTPALEELMRAAQPQSTSPRRGRVGMQEPRQYPKAGQAQELRQGGSTARQTTAGQRERAPQAGQPNQGQRTAAAPSAGNAPGQKMQGQPEQAAPKTASVPLPAQKAEGQSNGPQAGQQKKQGAKSAPEYACIQRSEKSVQPFPKIFPTSKWVKVEYPSFPGRGYYLSGEIFQGEKCAAKALAVPGRYALNPPAWLKGFETYLEDASAQGYWLLFCDMQGKAIPISQVFKGSQG